MSSHANPESLRASHPAETSGDSKPVIAIYQPNFLSVSMTFIYRQLKGVEDEFRPIVLATTRRNEASFPYEDVHVKAMSVLESVYSKLLRRAGGRVAPMFPGRARHWRSLLKNTGATLVHAHFGPSGIEILPVARALGLPLLVTFHGADASRLLRSRHYVARLAELFEYASVITVSSTMAQRLVGLGADPERVFVHHIGAPVEDFAFVRRKPLKEKLETGSEVRFLQVSNFIEKKGHRYTLEAFRNFALDYPNCRLQLAGDGRLRREIERLCDELAIRDKVEFVGAVAKPRVIELMSEADVFLHHSVTGRDGSQEGIPTVLMEAMATGLVVVSTYHSGIPELIVDGDNGFLVEERDVAAYTRKLLDDLPNAASVAERAAASVREHFNLSTQNEALKAIYRAVSKRDTAAASAHG